MNIELILNECLKFYEDCSGYSDIGAFRISANSLRKKLELGTDLARVAEYEIMNLKMLQSKYKKFDFDSIISKLEAKSGIGD